MDDTINKIPGIGPKKGKAKSKKQTEVEKRAAERKEKHERKIQDKPKGGKGPIGVGQVLGKYSKRLFDPEKAGGPIKYLKWQNIKISKKGIEIVKKHLQRFEEDDWNVKMIERLERIEKGELEISDFDKRFYTHEIREFERYKTLGHGKTRAKDLTVDEFDELWNNTHTATLEDFKLSEFIEYDGKSIRSIYHPDIQN